MTMYRIVITEIEPPVGSDASNEIERFRQTVDTLDVPRIVAMINTRPRQRRGANKPKQLQVA